MTGVRASIYWHHRAWLEFVLLEEEDIFESDFESTDEELAQDDVGQGDKMALEEDRQARKVRILRSTDYAC
jgi:hypothetical protein